MIGLDPCLTPAFYRSWTDPFFVGYRLARLRDQLNLTLQEQAEGLRLEMEQLAFLSLCQMPKDWVEVQFLASKVGMSAARLEELLGMCEASRPAAG